MLQKPPPSPSTGALRLLRWLALYGSFGTAAGATAFVLEEQRRQICRLSRIRDNGKKLREFMHRRNNNNNTTTTTTTTSSSSSPQTPAPSLPDFHDYVQDLELKGLVKRKPVTQSGKAGRDDYHYEMKPKSRPSGDNTGRKHRVNPGGVIGSSRRTFTTSSRTMRRGDSPPFRRLESIPHPEACPKILRANIIQQSKPLPPPTKKQARKKHKRLEKHNKRGACEALEALIAHRNDHLDPGDLQEFLSAAIRAEDFNAFGRLLNACEAEFPWSAHLYPPLLHSLVVASLPTSMSLSCANNISALGRRVLNNVPVDLTLKLESFHEAGAFPLVVLVYQKSPDHPWSPDSMTIILESTLRMTALGMDCTLLLTDIFHRIPKNGHFFRAFPQMHKKIDIPSGTRGRFHLTVLQSFGRACGGDNLPGVLEMLDMVLKHCVNVKTSQSAFGDVAIGIIEGNEPCCEEWYSRLLFCFRSLPHNSDKVLNEKLLELGVRRNFVNSVEYYGKRYNVQQSLAVAQARMLLDVEGATKFTAKDVDTLAFSLRGRTDLVKQLFRRCFHLELSDRTLQRCWTATIQDSTEDEIFVFLDTIHMQSSVMSHLYLERMRAALLRQLWRHQHNFDRVQALFEHINKVRDVDSKKAEAGILPSTMIAICAKAGRWKEAKHYTWDARHLSLESKAKLNPVGRYYETLLHARRGDWGQVKRNLDVSQQNPGSMYQPDELFLEIFSIFSQQHRPLETLDFCRWCISGGRASPTQHMFDILISHCLAEGDTKLISKVLAFMAEVEFQWQIRAQTVVLAFRKYANKYKPHTVPFMQCVSGLQRYPELLTKDVCLILMERCSVAARRLRMASRERLHLMQKCGQEKLVEQVSQLERLASTVPWVSQQRKTGSRGTGGSDNPLLERAQAYYIRMQVASSLHHWQEVISIFQESVQHHIPRLELSLCLAVTACLKLNEGIAGYHLIQDAQKLGFATTKAEVVMSQCWIGDQTNSADDLRKKVFQHYAYLHRQCLPLDHGLLVQAAHTLVLKSQPAASVALLSEVYQSSFAKIKPFDIVVMTSFLTGYSRILDIDGVRWAIRTILGRSLLLDVHFFRSLAQARYRFCQSLARDDQKKRSQEVYQLFMIWDTICWRRYEAQQRHVLITGRVMTNTLIRLYMKDAILTRLNSRARVRRLYGLRHSRATTQVVRHRPAARKEVISLPPRAKDGIWQLLKEEQQVENAFSAIEDWKEKEEQRGPAIPAIKDVDDAVSTLLDFDRPSSRTSRSSMKMKKAQEALSRVDDQFEDL